MARKKSARGASNSHRLRIVAGKWRRRLLPVADVDGLRPTSERVRETVFNWLTGRIDGARCLDLCAGSGALGFEALSRGAAHVTLIEKSGPALKLLREAARMLDASEAEIVGADAVRWLSEQAPGACDIVFIAPPYAADLLGELCRLLDDRDWLAREALIYLEHDRRQSPPMPERWETLKDKTAGNVRYRLMTVGVDSARRTA